MRTEYPVTQDSRFKNRYFGPLDLIGEKLDRVSVQFSFTKEGGLQRAKVSMPPENWRRIVATLERQRGMPRYGNMRSNNVFKHYLEWGIADVGVTAAISTIGGDLNGTLYAYPEGTVEFAHGPLRVSSIELIEKSRVEAEKLQSQIKLANERAEHSTTPAAAKAADFHARSQPTEADALLWVEEASARLKRGSCPSTYQQEFEHFDKIFALPGSRATEALLNAGYDPRALYYIGGIPANCKWHSYIAEPLIVKAMRAKNADSVALLATQGADVEYMSSNGLCLLEDAAWRSSAEVFMELLAAGARCSAKPDGQKAVVKEVVWRQPVEKLRALLDHNFKLTVDDLRTLTDANDLAKVRLATQRGYRWNDKELELSTLMARPEMLALLLKAGADPTAHLRRLVSQDFSYGTLPNEAHCEERVRILLANGAKVSAHAVEIPEIVIAESRAPEAIRKLLIAAREREIASVSVR